MIGKQHEVKHMSEEAKVKRDKAIDVLQEWVPDGGWHYDDVCALYDAIADGKIPGLKLED